MSDEEHVSEAPAVSSLPAPPQRPGANTGVKGVLADYADAQHSLALLQQAQNEAAWKEIEKPGGALLLSLREQEDLERRARELQDRKVERREDDDEDELSADDDEFMAQYRLKRLEELKAEQAAAMKAAYRPTFGTLLSLTGEQLTDSLDNVEHPDTFVIVVLMEAHLDACRMLNAIMSNLARKMVHNKFIKVWALRGRERRNGEQIHTWVRFADQIGGVISEEAVTAWLLKEGVLTLDDEQRERLMTAHEKRIEKFKSAQLIDPELMRKLTEILK